MSFDDEFDVDMDGANDGANDWGDDGDWEGDDGNLIDMPEQTIKPYIKQRVQRDLKELSLIDPLLISDVNWGGGSRISFRVGIPVEKLGLNIEQARAWGLIEPVGNHAVDATSGSAESTDLGTQSKYLFVELQLPDFYFASSSHQQVTVKVGTSNNTNMPVEQFVSQSTNQTTNQASNLLNKCQLSWPLSNYISNKVLPSLGALIEPLFDWNDVDHVIEACHGESLSQQTNQSISQSAQLLQAIKALIDCKSVHGAIEQITNSQPANHPAQDCIDLTDEQSNRASIAQSIKQSINKSFIGRLASRTSSNPIKTNHATSNTTSTNQSTKPSPFVQTNEHTTIQSTSQSTSQTVTNRSNKSSNQSISPNELTVMEICNVSVRRARHAIKICGDVDAAVEYVLDVLNQSGDSDLDDMDQLDTQSITQSINQSVNQSDDDLMSVKRKRSSIKPPNHSSKVTPKKAKNINQSNQSISQSIDPSIEHIISPLNQDLATLFSRHNFLVQICLKLIDRLMHLSSTCLMCMSKHPYPGLKLMVCNEALCRMSYEKLGVGFDVCEAIKFTPQLTDLYISFLYSASIHSHLPFNANESISVIDQCAIVNKDQSIDFTRLTLGLSRMPSVDQMLKWIDVSRNELFEQCNKLDVLLIPLIRWLHQSNPSFLRLMNPQERFKSMSTDHQFVLLMSSPEKEALFQAKKAACREGSFWAWHGSPLKNWHSIMRFGLKNLSNTNLMAHGAAYGKGIYMAADSATSLGYSNNHTSSAWSKSSLGASLTALALVEVVASAGTFKPFLVVEDESLCATRYLFVFDNTATRSTVKASDLVNEMKPSLLAFDPAAAIHTVKR